MEGIVYRLVDYKETSQIASLYTPEGNMNILVVGAKNYKKGNLGFCIPYNLVDFETSNASLKRLKEYTILNDYSSIRSNLENMRLVSIVFEIIKQCEDHHYARIFNFLKMTIAGINNGDGYLWTSVFLVKMLYVFGINLNFDCNNKKGFSLKKGGFIYEANSKFNFGLTLKYLYEWDFNTSLDLDMSQYSIIINQLIDYYDYTEVIYSFNLKKLKF